MMSYCSRLMACYKLIERLRYAGHSSWTLLNTIRRVHCFGYIYLSLDVRQDSERHADVFAELTRYLGLGGLCAVSEEDKQAFLLRELSSKRPLFPLLGNPVQMCRGD